MIHNRFPITAVPAVHLYTTAASLQGPICTHNYWSLTSTLNSALNVLFWLPNFCAVKTNTRNKLWCIWCVQQPSLDVRLQAAVSSELVLQEVGVVWGGDEVVAKRLAHVLVKLSMLRIKYGALLWAEVHLEAIERHGALLLGCAEGKTQMVLKQMQSLVYLAVKTLIVTCAMHFWKLTTMTLNTRLWIQRSLIKRQWHLM